MIITIVFATIAASYIFMGANRVGLGTDSVALSLSTITGTDVIWFLDMAVPLASLLALAVSTLVMLFLFYFYRRTKIGQAMLACSIDADAASLMGINVGAYTTLSFAFSAFLAGIAGVLITALASIKFDLGLSLLLKGFAGAVLGGMGNIGGAIVGALLIGQMESWGAAVIGGGYRDLVTFFIILLALIAFPKGLFRSHLVED
jgi:branched-chain amino acid transport system permease protein